MKVYNMNTAIKLSSLYASEVNTTLNLDFNQLLNRFGYKDQEKNGSAFFAGIKALTATTHFEDIQKFISEVDQDLFEIDIIELKTL
jgi:hypothetical protein